MSAYFAVATVPPVTVGQRPARLMFNERDDTAQMTHDLPRLQLDAMPPQLAKYLVETKVNRLGYLGEFFQCAANAPSVLMAFMQFTDALGHALPKQLVEVVALTISCFMSSDYERHQHEQLSTKLGFGNAWIAAVERLDPGAAEGLTEAERAVQSYVLLAISSRGIGASQAFAALLEHLTPEEAVAVVLLAGRYVTHALLVNTLKLEPPVPSIIPRTCHEGAHLDNRT